MSPGLPLRLAPTVVALAVLAGCGGGLELGIGTGTGGDDAPTVALAAVAEAAPGAMVRLAAAASDDFGVESVAFYRLETDGSATRLGSDGSAPWQWDVQMPALAGSAVRFFARAFDDAGQASDSDVVEIQVRG